MGDGLLMPKIKVHYSGLFRRIARKREERVNLTDATLEGLVRALEDAYGEGFTQALRDPQRKLNPGVTTFVNGAQFPGWQAPLTNGDNVAFLFFTTGG
jgi:molybdopterin converting factor small subunit